MAMSENASPPFQVVTNPGGSETVLSLRGRVENLGAFQLGASLDAAIDHRPQSIVLDLSDLEFIGTAGLVAVANAEHRLAEMGGVLIVRSPTGLVDRLLDLIDTARMMRLLDQATLDPADPSGAAAPELTSTMVERALGRRSAEFRKVTALPSDPHVIDGALRLIVELARALVGAADGVSVSLLRHGRLSTVAASDQTIMDMDADQYRTGEGPCVDASSQGRWFLAAELSRETRWPSFTPQALGLGINAILSSPLVAHDTPVGALNIYSRTARAFGPKDQAAAAVFAKKASVILSDAGAGVSDAQVALRYQDALKSRKSITLATGVIMEREGVDEDTAFTDLLRLSLSYGERLRAQADAVLRSTSQSEIGSGAKPNA